MSTPFAACAKPAPRPWLREGLRVLAILAAASALGLITNAAGDRPVPLLARDGPGAPPERAPRLGIETLRAALASPRPPLLLDVRREELFATAHANGALNAPADAFITHYQQLNLATLLQTVETVVLICESDQCPSGDRVAKLLRELGHTNARVLQGGWMEYSRSNLPRSGGSK